MTDEFDYPLILHYGRRFSVPLHIVFSGRYSHVEFHDMQPVHCFDCHQLIIKSFRKGRDVRGRNW